MSEGILAGLGWAGDPGVALLSQHKRAHCSRFRSSVIGRSWGSVRLVGFRPFGPCRRLSFVRGRPRVHHNPTSPTRPRLDSPFAIPPYQPPIPKSDAPRLCYHSMQGPDEAHMPPSKGSWHEPQEQNRSTTHSCRPCQTGRSSSIADERCFPNTALPLTGDGVGITLERDDDAPLLTCACWHATCATLGLLCCHL